MSIAEIAVATATTEADVRVIPHWIDGGERASTSGRTAPVYNLSLIHI